MELDELLKLIQAVSDSELTGFKYEAEGVCLNLKKEKEELEQQVKKLKQDMENLLK